MTPPKIINTNKANHMSTNTRIRPRSSGNYNNCVFDSNVGSKARRNAELIALASFSVGIMNQILDIGKTISASRKGPEEKPITYEDMLIEKFKRDEIKTQMDEFKKQKEENILIEKQKEETLNSTSKLNDWRTESSSDYTKAESGKAGVEKKTPDFDMAGVDYQNAKTSGDENRAKELYKQNVLETAKGEIALYDTDKDGTISLEEQEARKIADEKKSCGGELNQEKLNEYKDTSLKTNMFMDLNNDKVVDQEEYAAFLAGEDANSAPDQGCKGKEDGKISREEHKKSLAGISNYSADSAKTDEETNKARDFRKNIIASYKNIFRTNLNQKD